MKETIVKFLSNIMEITPKDKLLHKEIGELAFLLTFVVLSIVGVGIYTSIVISLVITSLIAFLKEYWIDVKCFVGNKPDNWDAIWTILGGFELSLLIVIVRMII